MERRAATFISFVADYPKHKDVDAALYWMAFALKKQGKFAEADRQLERLIREHPRSNWLDDARAMRVEIAGQTGNRQVVERELDKNDLEIKAIALQSLFQSNPDRAAAFVADLLKPGSVADRRLKENAIDLLGQHMGPRTTPMLMELARNQTDPKARKKAIFWLGQSGDESAIDLLKEVVMHGPTRGPTRRSPRPRSSRSRSIPAPALTSCWSISPAARLRRNFGVTRSSGSASAARKRRWTT